MASVGGFTLIDAQVMSKVQQIGDAELATDANRLSNKSLRAGTGEYYAGLCLQQYINARYAEQNLARVTDPRQKAQLQGDAMAYGACSSTCKSAHSEVHSSYDDLAAKYEPKCASGFAGQKAGLWLDALAKQIETFKRATSPLELYYGEQGARLALVEAQQQAPNDERVVKAAAEIDALATRHATEIRRAKTFLDSSEAQGNLGRQRTLQAEIGATQAEIKGIQDQQSRAGGSLDDYMAKRKLDDQIAAKRRVLDAKNSELARARQELEKLAAKAGVR
jgi:hypothetical protein